MVRIVNVLRCCSFHIHTHFLEWIKVKRIAEREEKKITTNICFILFFSLYFLLCRAIRPFIRIWTSTLSRWFEIVCVVNQSEWTNEQREKEEKEERSICVIIKMRVLLLLLFVYLQGCYGEGKKLQFFFIFTFFVLWQLFISICSTVGGQKIADFDKIQKVFAPYY